MQAHEEGAEMSLSYPFLHIPFIDGEQARDDEDATEGIEVGDIGLEEHGFFAIKDRMREKDIDDVLVGKTRGNVKESRKERKREDCKERKEEKMARREEEKEILEVFLGENGKQGEDCVKSREESNETDVAQHQRKIPRVETWCSSSMSKSPSAPLHQSTMSTKSASPALSLGELSATKIGRSSSSPRLRENNR